MAATKKTIPSRTIKAKPATNLAIPKAAFGKIAPEVLAILPNAIPIARARKLPETGSDTLKFAHSCELCYDPQGRPFDPTYKTKCPNADDRDYLNDLIVANTIRARKPDFKWKPAVQLSSQPPEPRTLKAPTYPILPVPPPARPPSPRINAPEAKEVSVLGPVSRVKKPSPTKFQKWRIEKTKFQRKHLNPACRERTESEKRTVKMGSIGEGGRPRAEVWHS